MDERAVLGLAGPGLLRSAGVLMARSTGVNAPALGGASIFTRDCNAAATRVSPTKGIARCAVLLGLRPSPRLIEHVIAARGSSPVSWVAHRGVPSHMRLGGPAATFGRRAM